MQTRLIGVALGCLGLFGCSGQKITITPEQAAGAVACTQQVQTLIATARAQVSSCEALARTVISSSQR